MTAEGETFALPDPFIVIATQNPIDLGGYPLPGTGDRPVSRSYNVGYPRLSRRWRCSARIRPRRR